MFAARWVKSFLSCCLLLSALFALASPTNGAPEEPREVIAGIPRSWPPQYSLDDNGNPTGFAIDIMNEVAARAGVRVTYHVMDSFADVSEAMNDGSIDLIPNSGITPDRAARHAFTAPVETFVISMFVRDDTLDMRGVDDLRGHKVGVVEFNVGQRLMQDRDDIELVVYRDAETALFSLVAGHVEAMVYPQPVLLNLARQVGIEDRIAVVGAPLREIKRGIRVQKGETELLAALNQAVSDFVGTPAYRAIYVKWYGAAKPFWTVSRVILAMGALAVFVLITVSWWRYRSVLKLNRDLLESVAKRERAEEALRESETRARDAEQELLDAIESISEGFVLFDADGRLVLCNRKYKEMYGYSDTEAVPGTHTRDLGKLDLESGRVILGSEDPEAYLGRRDHPTDVPLKSYTIHLADGRYLQTRDRHTAEGGIVSIQADITERKAAEEAMLAAMKEAEIANRTKSEFLTNMSHELRTPLNAIIGFSEIIKDETFGPVGSTKYRDYADDINESGQHLLALINDILDLSKIESGTDELHEENIDIPEIANATMKLVMGLAHAGNVELELDVSDDIPVLHADERKVKQILLNLLSNAIKFTPDGGKATLKIWSRAKSGYVFQVVDTGIGIAFEDIPKALAPFQQIDSGLNRKHEGTGLGLPLAKSLVEMHGGYLDLQSEIGVGTTVTVRFPAERIVPSPRDANAVDAADRKAG
jgi:signal transduction histidine kinase